MATGPTYKRRGGPVDWEVAHDGAPPSTVENSAADADYFGNLKKFRRTDDMASEPNRSKKNEADQKP